MMRPGKEIKKLWKQSGVKMPLKEFARRMIGGTCGPGGVGIAREWLRAKKVS